MSSRLLHNVNASILELLVQIIGISEDVISNITNTFNSFLNVTLTLAGKRSSATELSPEKQILPLSNYLNTQLTILNDNLYLQVFKFILTDLWTNIIKDFEYIIQPPNPKLALTPIQCTQVKHLLKPLCEFFNANGEGIPDITLIDDTKKLNIILDAASASK